MRRLHSFSRVEYNDMTNELVTLVADQVFTRKSDHSGSVTELVRACKLGSRRFNKLRILCGETVRIR